MELSGTIDIDLRYTPTPRQYKAHIAPQRFKLFGGAMGGGKSYWLCMEVLRRLLECPGNRALMARYHLSDFKNTTLRTLLGIIPEKLYDARFGHNKTEHTIKLYNGSEILYMGLSEETDVNKLKSMEVGIFAFDESSEIPLEQFTLAGTRLRHKLPNGDRPYYFGILTSNPEDCWLKDKFIKGNIDKSRYLFIPSLPKDNPYLPHDYEEHLRKDLPEDWVRRYLEGSWEDLTVGNFVIPREIVEKAINKELPLSNRYCMGIDVGRGVGGDETVIYVGDKCTVVDFNFDTSESIDKTTLRAQNLINQYDVEATCVDDIGIGAGVTDFLTLNLPKCGIEGINVGRKSQDERFLNMRAEVWWYARDQFLEGKVSIPDDPKLIRQLTAVKYIIRNNGKIMIEQKMETRKRIGQSTDRADGLNLVLWASRDLAGAVRDYGRDVEEYIKEISRDRYGWSSLSMV